MPLRKADKTQTRRFEDDGAYLVLRTGGLSKGESDRVKDLTAAYSIDPAQIAGADPEQAARIEVNNRVADANRKLFAVLCTDWSLGEVSEQAYADLDEASGRWVDQCINDVLVERRERAEGNAPSSRKPRKRASTSKPAEE